MILMEGSSIIVAVSLQGVLGAFCIFILILGPFSSLAIFMVLHYEFLQRFSFFGFSFLERFRVDCGRLSTQSSD